MLNKIIIICLSLILSIPLFSMDFSGTDVNSANKVNQKNVINSSNPKVNNIKNETSKKEVIKKSNEKDSSMNFGEGMVFTDEEIKEDGKISEKEMNFSFIEENKNKKDKKVDEVKITKKQTSHVVKGFYFKISSGTTFMFTPTIANNEKIESKSYFGFGVNTSLSIGYDIIDLLSVEIYGNFVFNQAEIKSEENLLYHRDLNSRTLGLALNLNLGLSERAIILFNVHAGLLFIDKSLDMSLINFSGGGLFGFEYYLLLKHFAANIYFSVDYMTGFNTASMSLNASLKYTF